MPNNTSIDISGVITTNNENIDFTKTVYAIDDKLYDMNNNLIADFGNKTTIYDYLNKADTDTYIVNRVNSDTTVTPIINVTNVLSGKYPTVGTITNYSSDTIYDIYSDSLKVTYNGTGPLFTIESPDLSTSGTGNLYVTGTKTNKRTSQVYSKAIEYLEYVEINDQELSIDSSNMDIVFSKFNGVNLDNNKIVNKFKTNIIDSLNTSNSSKVHIDSSRGVVNTGDILNINNELVTVSNVYNTGDMVKIGNSEYNKFSFSAGSFYKIDEHGDLWVVGRNYFGMLGLGHDNGVYSGWVKSNISDVVSVHVSSLNAYVLKSNGEVWGCGINGSGQLATGDTTNSYSWVHLSGINAKSISAGGSYILAIDYNGDVYGVGNNSYGFFGNNTTDSTTTWVSCNMNAKFVAAGYGHSMVIKENGEVWATGNNMHGELGIGETSDPDVSAGYKVWQQSGISNASYISLGDEFSHLLDINGKVYSCGSNDNGQLGINSNTSIFNTWQTDAVYALEIGCGINHAAIKNADGRIAVTGNNSNGELGISGYSSIISWTSPPGTDFKIAKLCIGSTGTGFIKTGTSLDNKVYATGEFPDPSGNIYNHNGYVETSYAYPELTQSYKFEEYWFEPVNTINTTDFSTAYIVSDLITNTVYQDSDENNWRNIKNISAVVETKNYMEDNVNNAANKIYLDNKLINVNVGDIFKTDSGENVTVSEVHHSATLYNVGEVSGFSDISIGEEHSLALDNDGYLWATGENSDGQFGNGTNISSKVWIKIPNVKAKKIVSSYGFSALLTEDNIVYVTGNNEYGQLGMGNTTNINIWTKINLLGVTDIFVGRHVLFCVVNHNTLYGSGTNFYHELGLSTTQDYLNFSKIPLPEIGEIKKVVSVSRHTLILYNNGKTFGTGYNAHGQLCTGNTDSLESFTRTTASDQVIDIDTGYSHTVFIYDDNTVWGCGDNEYGELGDGTITDSSSLVRSGTMTAISVTCCDYGTTIIDGTNDAYYVGGDFNKRFGNNGDSTEWTLITSWVDKIHLSNTTMILSLSNSFFQGFGDNSNGQLGTGNYETNMSTSIYLRLGMYYEEYYIVPSETLSILPTGLYKGLCNFELNNTELDIAEIFYMENTVSSYATYIFKDMYLEPQNTIDNITLSINLNNEDKLISFNAGLYND